MNLQELPTATPFASSSIPDEKLAFLYLCRLGLRVAL
jgi:hypothetical protein